MEEEKEQEGKLVLYNRNTLYRNESKTLLSFDGAMTTEGKEPLFFTGIYDKDEGYEDCYLLVAESPEIFETNISKQEFVDLAKKYCKSRSIPTHENGNIIGEGFPFFERLVEDADAPAPMLRERNHKDMEIYTILHDDYFPMMYNRDGNGVRSYFGKFIGENRIKAFSSEEVYLLGTHTLVD